jgi:hypothetical protein
MRPRISAAVLTAVVVSLTAAGCSSGDDGGAIPIPSTTPTTAAGGTTTTSPGGSSPTSAATVSSTTAPAGGSTAPVSVAPDGRPRALLTAVRLAARPEGGDRIVFEFRNGVPAYSVSYVSKPVTADGSGDDVPLKGSSALEIRFAGASGFDMEAGQPSYTGSTRIAGPGDPVAELVRSGDFEAVLTWVAGTVAKAPFTVHELLEPARLVVDLNR